MVSKLITQTTSILNSVASEESAEELKRSVLAKTGGITDVVACIGGFWLKGPVLDQSLEEFTKVCQTNPEKLCCVYLVSLVYLFTGS